MNFPLSENRNLVSNDDISRFLNKIKFLCQIILYKQDKLLKTWNETFVFEIENIPLEIFKSNLCHDKSERQRKKELLKKMKAVSMYLSVASEMKRKNLHHLFEFYMTRAIEVIEEKRLNNLMKKEKAHECFHER